MNRPYIICHMVTSMDGKVTGKFLESEAGLKAAEQYYKIHREFGADGFICGRLTMESSFTGGWYPDLTAFQGQKVEREDYIATYDAEFHAIAFDTHGRLGWKASVLHDEDSGYDKAHIVEVLSEDVEDAYLAYLRSIGVSYVFAGEKEIDVELALYKLWHNCIGTRFLLEGGSVLNGAFAKADVIDELSLVQAPVLGEKGDKPLFYDEVAGDYQLMKAEVLENTVWLRYHSNSCNAKPRLKLSIIMDAIEGASDEWQYFYDLKAHKSIWLSQYSSVDDEEERELLEEEPERFILLPSKYEIHEYSIMEEFVESLPKGTVQNQLFNAIQGRGAFRRFKDGVNRLGIAKQWYDYQEKAYRELAIRWCEDNEYEVWEDK